MSSNHVDKKSAETAAQTAQREFDDGELSLADEVDDMRAEQTELIDQVQFIKEELSRVANKLTGMQSAETRMADDATTQGGALRLLIRKFARHEEEERKERLLLISYLKEDFEERKLFRETIVEVRDLIKSAVKSPEVVRSVTGTQE
jgi:predicted nuclease with TOPRIM domain